MRRTLLVLGICLLPLGAAAAQPRSYVATVTHVSDGDTLWVRPPWGGAPVSVRLQGIDAPELCQPWGPAARSALAQRLQHQPVTVHERGRDDYDRVLARVHLSGRDMGGWLVVSGLAWSASWRRARGPYDGLQAQAQQARRGLWSDPRPLAPRAFRKLHGACPRDAR